MIIHPTRKPGPCSHLPLMLAASGRCCWQEGLHLMTDLEEPMLRAVVFSSIQGGAVSFVVEVSASRAGSFHFKFRTRHKGGLGFPAKTKKYRCRHGI